MRGFVRLLTSAAMLAAAVTAAVAQEAPASPPVAVDPAKGLPEWEKIYAVFSHPRCASCHVEDNRPRWSGAHYGKTRVHGFNVQGGSDGSGFGNPGLRCTTCHFESNFQNVAWSARCAHLASRTCRNGLVAEIVG